MLCSQKASYANNEIPWMSLLQLAFDHVGSMPMSKIQEHRAEKQAIMSADLRQRSSKKNLHRAIQRGSSMTGPSGKGALLSLHCTVKSNRKVGWVHPQMPHTCCHRGGVCGGVTATTLGAAGAAEEPPHGQVHH